MKLRKKKPLGELTLRAILIVSASLILIFGSIGFALNIATNIQGYKRDTTHSLEFALSILDVDYLKYICESVKKTYAEAEADGLDDPKSKEYIERFTYLLDDDFWYNRSILERCMEKAKLDSVAIIIPDYEKKRLIFVLDGYDLSLAYVPGQWTTASSVGQDSLETIEKIASSEASMKFGYGEVNGWVATNYVRVTDADGNFLGYIMGDIYINEFVENVAKNLFLFFAVLVILILLIARAIAEITKRNIIDPINLLARTADEYTKRDKTSEDVPMAFFTSKYMGVSQEMDTLSKSLVEMEKDINGTMKRIREMTAEKERIAAELSVATEIQAGVLRTTFPPFPERKEFDIYASMTPAKEVGGDLYDFFLIDDDHLCIAVGDVSGKSVPAALFMVITTIVIRNVARTQKDVSRILELTNLQLCRNNREFLFVTLWLGIYTISEKKMVFASAGHEYPAIYRKSEDKYELYVTPHDIPLGIKEEMEFSEDTIHLSSGDKLFLYTDGVPEATGVDEKMYGPNRMIECLNRNKSLFGKELLTAVEDDVNEFIGGASQFDDLTMLCFEVK